MCALRRHVAAQEQSSCAVPDQQQQQAPAISECHADPLPESREATSLSQDNSSPCLQVGGLDLQIGTTMISNFPSQTADRPFLQVKGNACAAHSKHKALQ